MFTEKTILDQLEITIKVIEEFRKNLIEDLKFLKDNNYEEVLKLWNLFLFFLVNTEDLYLAIENYIKASSGKQKNFTSRVVALLCYQKLDDFKHITGNKFGKELGEIINAPDLMKEFSVIRKKFLSFSESNSLFFRGIRNDVLAHRNQNIEEQLLFLERIDSTDIMIKAMELSELDDYFFAFYCKIKISEGYLKNKMMKA